MSELCAHARQELVRRLDHNYRHHRLIFDKVLDVILDEFETIMRRQALTGRATIRSVNPVFSEPVAAGIALDVLTERGFHASLDYIRETTPAYRTLTLTLTLILTLTLTLSLALTRRPRRLT